MAWDDVMQKINRLTESIAGLQWDNSQNPDFY